MEPSGLDTDFPFKTRLSYEHLVAFWKEELNSDSAAQRAIAERVFDFVPEDHPLRGFEVSIEQSEKYAEQVDLLMTAVFPSSSRRQRISAAFIPFEMTPVFETRRFKELNLFCCDRVSVESSLGNVNENGTTLKKTVTAFHVILKELYQADTRADHSFIIGSKDCSTGLQVYHRIELDTQFVRIVVNGEKPELSKEQIQELLDNPMDVDRLRAALPPEKFEFQGFSIIRAVPVTDHEVLSRLKQDLLAKNALVSPTNLDIIQDRVRSLLELPELRLGVVALDRCVRGQVTGARSIGRSLVLANGMPDCKNPEKTLYYQAMESHNSLIINGLTQYEGATSFEKELVKEGIESFYLAPLMNKDLPIGFLEIGSPLKGDIPAILRPILDEVASLFSTALKRSLDEQEDRVQALIKKRFTAIHPVVEWKFRRAAIQTLTENDPDAVNSISFKNVHSFFATCDIRGSSVKRGEAIQQDLAEQMGLALAVVIAASTERPGPSLDELGYRIDQHIEKVLSQIHSGDELTYTTFLREEIEPLFEEFRTYSPDVETNVKKYYGSLDNDLGILYRKRKDFDESVKLINEAVSRYVYHRQEEAQAMVPHYFEMYRTDGVEFSMYAGQSLLNGATFNEIDLSNLRLWQLITMAGVTSQTRRLLPELPVELETAQLILLQFSPVDVHFRVDEKKFDVQGAYNIRYEIVKKRVDKATVVGTGERLTQPGMIALVYSHELEEQEYMRYLNYLFAAGYFEGEIEMLELDPLPGVNGLKAMRITVAENPPGLTSFPIPQPGTITSQKTDSGAQAAIPGTQERAAEITSGSR